MISGLRQVLVSSHKDIMKVFLVFLIGIIGVLNILNIAKAQTFDIFDEAAHFDYVDKLQNGFPPKTGEFLSQKTLLMIDCTGSWPSIPKNCQQIERKPENYPAQGFSYESQQPPIAYMPFFLLNSSKVMTQERLFDYRLGNIFWYVTAIFLLLFFVFRQKFSTFQTFLLSIPMLLSPIALHAFGTINNDAIGLVAGLLFLVIPLANFRSKRIEFLILTIFGIFLGLSKAIFLFLPFSMFVALVILGLVQNPIRGSDSFETIKINILKVSGNFYWTPVKLTTVTTFGFISTFLYFILQEFWAVVPVSNVLFALGGFSLTDQIQIRTINIGIISNLQLFSSYAPSNLSQIASFAVVGILVLALNSQLYEYRVFGFTFIFGVVALAIFWASFMYLAGNFNFASPTRYMIVFIPIITYCIPKLPRLVGLSAVVPILTLALLAL